MPFLASVDVDVDLVDVLAMTTLQTLPLALSKVIAPTHTAQVVISQLAKPRAIALIELN